MIYGIGIDLVKKSRVSRAFKRFGDRFILRVLTEREWLLCQKKGDSIGSIAARIAAKEAVFKALGTGWAKGIGWHDVEVLNDSQGKPLIRLYGEVGRRTKGLQLHLSISHERESAIAFAVIEEL